MSFCESMMVVTKILGKIGFSTDTQTTGENAQLKI